MVHDPALAKQARDGWEKDQSSAFADPTGRRAMLASQVAFAEQRWNDAIAPMQEANKRFEVRELFAVAFIGQAFDLAGKPDSAIAYLEKFVAIPDPTLDEHPNFLAASYKRLGELYDAKGNRAKAIENFEKFAEMWKGAEPELQPKVREVQEKLRRLRDMKG
jgi:tetratricopeptide (TPR) repeat protein